MVLVEPASPVRLNSPAIREIAMGSEEAAMACARYSAGISRGGSASIRATQACR